MTRTDGETALDGQLCFALYAASRAMTARYRPYLDELGLTYPQYLVLVVLWDEGSTSVSGLGDRLRLDSGTLSPLLKRLEGIGLVTRTRSSDDERSVLISATPKSLRLRERATQIPQQISASLTGIEHARLMGDLHRLEAALRDAD